MKKIVLLFTFLMTLGLQARAENVTIDGMTYALNEDHTATLTKGADRETVEIPAQVSYGGNNYAVTNIGNYAFQYCESLASVNIPNSVTSIGNGAFYRCNSLTSVNIGNSVTTIGDRAFLVCSSLTSVNIPNSVTTIYDLAFQDCSSLTSVNIGNSVTTIGHQAFLRCSSLTSVNIPNSVTSIGNSAFSYCSSLTSMVVAEGNAVYDSREGCNAIIETASNALIQGCNGTVIPNSVTSIGDHAFAGFENLTSITIPEGVTSIGDYAFNGCTSLTSVTIPNSVTSIGDYAFRNCSGLTSVTSLITEPFRIYTVFYGIADSATLYVPKGTKAAYEATEGWTDNFANVVELGDDPSAILNPSAPQAAGEDAVYNLNGVRVGQPTKQGVYIVNGKKVAMP